MDVVPVVGHSVNDWQNTDKMTEWLYEPVG